MTQEDSTLRDVLKEKIDAIPAPNVSRQKEVWQSMRNIHTMHKKSQTRRIVYRFVGIGIGAIACIAIVSQIHPTITDQNMQMDKTENSSSDRLAPDGIEGDISPRMQPMAVSAPEDYAANEKDSFGREIENSTTDSTMPKSIETPAAELEIPREYVEYEDLDEEVGGKSDGNERLIEINAENRSEEAINKKQMLHEEQNSIDNNSVIELIAREIIRFIGEFFSKVI